MPWDIRNNEEPKTYIDVVKPYPVYAGLQPMSPEWSKNLLPKLIAQADYVSIDPQIISNGNGSEEQILVWEYASYIDDPEVFMERNKRHCTTILYGDEPLDIFACTHCFSPFPFNGNTINYGLRSVCSKLLMFTRQRNIDIEINDPVRVPHEEFVLMAKKAGLNFTFGAVPRDRWTSPLDYCKQVASKCRPTQKDFFVPERKL